MATSKRNWERNELLLALNLYCRLPFGQFHSRNKDVIVLAEAIGRTPGAVAYKLCNFAHLDPTLEQKGASNVGKLDRLVWEEFWRSPEDVISESSALLEQHSYVTEVEGRELYKHQAEVTGSDRRVLTWQRVNQSYFRKMILTAYQGKCCITGLDIPDLLVASHILPWAEYHEKRMEPTNGLCLSATYDKAFDRHLISFDEDYRMIVSSQLRNNFTNVATQEYFLKKVGRQLTLPHRFLPSKEYIAQHREQLQA